MMPVITLEAGKMNKEQKEALIAGFTNVASEILKVDCRAFIVLLKENEHDNIGTGGKCLSKVLAERNR